MKNLSVFPLEVRFKISADANGSLDVLSQDVIRQINDVLCRELPNHSPQLFQPPGGIDVRDLDTLPVTGEGEGIGLPSDAELAKIASWPYADMAGLLDFVQTIWSADGRIWKDGGLIYMATGGFSGNEMIITALQRTVFWGMCWERSERGGRHVFHLPPDWKERL
jgi:hypothetical protein